MTHVINHFSYDLSNSAIASGSLNGFRSSSINSLNARSCSSVSSGGSSKSTSSKIVNVSKFSGSSASVGRVLIAQNVIAVKKVFRISVYPKSLSLGFIKKHLWSLHASCFPIIDKNRKSVQISACVAEATHGIATPIDSQALEPRPFVRGFLWSSVKVNLRVIRSCERGCKYWIARSPRIATSCDRFNDNHRRIAMSAHTNSGCTCTQKPADISQISDELYRIKSLSHTAETLLIADNAHLNLDGALHIVTQILENAGRLVEQAERLEVQLMQKGAA